MMDWCPQSYLLLAVKRISIDEENVGDVVLAVVELDPRHQQGTRFYWTLDKVHVGDGTEALQGRHGVNPVPEVDIVQGPGIVQRWIKLKIIPKLYQL